MLKHRVLDIAVNEINEKTDIFVEYTLENMGRKVIALLLKVKPKNEGMLEHNARHSIREKLQAFGVSDKKIEALLKKHDEQYLWANISIVEEQLKKGKITNTTGYLLTSFESDFRSAETEQDQSKKKQKALKAQETEAAKAREAERQSLLDAFETWKGDLVKTRIGELAETEIARLKNAFIESISNNEIFKRIYNSKGFEYPTIQIQWHKFLCPVLLTPEELDFSIYSN